MILQKIKQPPFGDYIKGNDIMGKASDQKNKLAQRIKAILNQ